MKKYLYLLVKFFVHKNVRIVVLNYLGRLNIWWKLTKFVKGVQVPDRFFLWISMIASPITSLSSLSEWRDPRLLKDIVVVSTDEIKFNLRARTDDLWHVVPFRESAVLETVKKFLRPGDCFVDAGANIGYYTLVASKAVGSDGKVMAIEMMSVNAEILRRHLNLNNAENVTIIEAALYSYKGASLYATMPEGSFGQASIIKIHTPEAIKLESTTLDEVLNGIPNVRLLKMDIEGAELDALKGAENVLNQVDAIIFEHLNGEIDNIKLFLEQRSFKVFSLDWTNSLAVRCN